MSYYTMEHRMVLVLARIVILGAALATCAGG